jgi:hypothetical protein
MLPFPSPLLSVVVAGSGAFNPTTLFSGGVAGGWWDPSDLSTLWKDTAGTSAVTSDGDAVARIDDKSGNGNNLLQATLANRPLYKTSGGLSWLLFDGSNDYVRATFAMGTTWDRVMAWRDVSSAFPRQFFGGVSANECLYDGGAGSFIMFNGSANGPTMTSTTSDVVSTERWANPAPCQIAADNGSYTSSPSIAAVNPGGLTVAASSSAGDFTGIRWYGGVMINKALTGTEISGCRTFFGAKQGRVL